MGKSRHRQLEPEMYKVLEIQPPVLNKWGYWTSFEDQRFGRRQNWVGIYGLTESGNWPVARAGRFMFKWEPAHFWYCGVGRSEWAGLDAFSKMDAELTLQILMWAGDSYSLGVCRNFFRKKFDEVLARHPYRGPDEFDTYFEKPYGPSEWLRHRGKHARRLLRSEGLPVPAYRTAPRMPMSNGDAEIIFSDT